MDKKKDIIKKLKEFKKAVSGDVPIEKLFLFGSQVKGNVHKWSDVDLIVVSSKFEGKKSFKGANRLYDYWSIDKPVDFLCYTPDEFNKLKNQITIVREAVKEGIEI